MGPPERLSVDGSCHLKPVIGMAIFWLIGRPEVAANGRPAASLELRFCAGNGRRARGDHGQSGMRLHA
jgi:hypothetical protein